MVRWWRDRDESTYTKCSVIPTKMSTTEKRMAAGHIPSLNNESFVCMKKHVVNEDVVLVALLKDCAKKNNLHEGNRLHACLFQLGLPQHNVFLGSAVVNVYAKCGALARAQQVFDELSVRNAVCWNVLLAAYAQHGHNEQALHIFHGMQLDGFSPDVVTYSCMLKVCGNIKSGDQGRDLHDEIIRKGLLGKDHVLGTALVDMYAKCGRLAKAQEVFDKLLIRDVVSWTALITGYCKHGLGEQALCCYERMQQQGLCPNTVTFACILKACGNIQAVDAGINIHVEVERKGSLRKDIVLWNALVDMYAKCGAIAQAESVFHTLPTCNVVSWTALVVGYCQQGQSEKALHCFERMRVVGLFPDDVTFTHMLQACGSTGGLQKGRELHVEILFLGKLSFLGNALVDMYAKCGALSCAKEAFDELPVRDLISWNTLIAGYCEHSLGGEALRCFVQMQEKGISPDAATCACILQACGSTDAAEKGKEIHMEIVKKGWLDKNPVLGNVLVGMYAKQGASLHAQEVFDTLCARDVVSWNVLMAGYAQAGGYHFVFDLFDEMEGEGLEPNRVTYTLVLNACGHFGSVSKGQSYFESMTLRHGIIPTLEHHTFMVDLFGRAGHFDKAIALMPSSGYLPAWFSLLLACKIWRNVKLGALAFEQIVRLDVAFIDAYVCMSKIYAATGMQKDAAVMLFKAQQVLFGLVTGDVTSWNKLIAGYCHHGLGDEALLCSEQMESHGVSPNVVTFLCLLKACGSVGASKRGEMLHDEIIRRGLLEASTLIGTAIVDMYGKCGALLKAQEVFNDILSKDVVAWTVLMAGYCQHGYGHEVLICFERMKSEGVSPDTVTFVCILKACSILGAAEKGRLYFETMSSSYGIVSNSKHHTCLVDLHGCAGQFSEVMRFMKTLPSSSYYLSWSALLGACRKRGNERVGMVAFQHAVPLLDERSTGICSWQIRQDEDFKKVKASNEEVFVLSV